MNVVAEFPFESTFIIVTGSPWARAHLELGFRLNSSRSLAASIGDICFCSLQREKGLKIQQLVEPKSHWCNRFQSVDADAFSSLILQWWHMLWPRAGTSRTETDAATAEEAAEKHLERRVGKQEVQTVRTARASISTVSGGPSHSHVRLPLRS